MANTYTLIQAQTLASAAASVTFSSIPATFTDLVVRFSVRSTAASDWMIVVLNDITTSIYSETWLKGSGSAASSTRKANTSYFGGDGNDLIINLSGSTANTFTSGEFYLPSYTVSQNKPSNFFLATENNATDATITSLAGLWRNTATVNEIKFDTAGISFASGSSFYLYGIKNS
jgi:hypothetical protein